MTLDCNWFTEIDKPNGAAFSLKIKDKIYAERSPYQLIEVYETERFGTLLTLDGIVMLTDRDNFIYHEMMTHPALFSHPNPQRVLVIGGGDCGSLREVLKHPGIEQVELVELDERVTRVAETYFPELCESNGDARARFHFTDGVKWAAEVAPGSYDVIIVDSTDPEGPALGLFSKAFYSDCLKALAPRGILIAQSESPIFHVELIKTMRVSMQAAGFSDVITLNFPQCVYPSGWWTATLARKDAPLAEFRVQDVINRPFPTRYYNHRIHHAAMAMPEFVRQALMPSNG